jgi:hypothetical protein
MDGFVRELEVYKEDGSIPTGVPPVSDLKIFAAHSKEAGIWNREPGRKVQVVLLTCGSIRLPRTRR